MPDTTPLAKLAPQSSLRDASQSREEAPRQAVPTRKPTRKAFWMKQLHTWHWMSSAVSLIGLLLFAITGFTLNHAADIEGSPVVTQGSAQMPAALLTRLKAAVPDAEKAPLPAEVAAEHLDESPMLRNAPEISWRQRRHIC